MEGEKIKTRSNTPIHFLGLSLSGGKSSYSSLCCLEYYPEERRLFLSELNDYHLRKVKQLIHEDEEIITWIHQKSNSAMNVVFDVPLTLPPCFLCSCFNKRGPEFCPRNDVQWLLSEQKKLKKKTLRTIVPYTQRPLDFFLERFEGQKFEIPYALGSNLAPVVARGFFLKQRIEIPCYEINPRVTAYIIGKSLQMNFFETQRCFSSLYGFEARKKMIVKLIEKTKLFIYQQDQKILFSNPHSFNSFLAAYCGFLYFQKKAYIFSQFSKDDVLLLPEF